MELDKTTIVLKQRSLLDLIDLSLVVLRVYWKELLNYSLIGIVPFALLNYVILRPIADYETLLMYDNFILDEGLLRFRYVCYLAGLVFVQMPFALLGVTYFLGQMLFKKPVSIREFFSILWQMLAGLLLILGTLRFSLIATIIVALLPRRSEYSDFLEVFWLGFLLCGMIAATRAFRPFAPEILLLEQSPLLKTKETKNGKSNTYGKRSSLFHTNISGDLVGRCLAMMLAIFMLVSSFTLCELFLTGVFFGAWTWDWWLDIFLLPLNLWVVAVWATVFRFLSYIDSRTRMEGWELDLRLRAEAKRIAGVVD